ncbi:hypothetical protein Nans01_43650 [Nocardiopsis ansamitocini]|uniref:Uncharacterized protein n=1 Tax=Nocardiopsis ansamitocini TaxID=1670832 RepID=A0A9W6UKI7_9ACTN|nr:hypothetical protein Nans01_43650 [Nocardiopsis ansamitocini]
MEERNEVDELKSFVHRADEEHPDAKRVEPNVADEARCAARPPRHRFESPARERRPPKDDHAECRADVGLRSTTRRRTALPPQGADGTFRLDSAPERDSATQ